MPSSARKQLAKLKRGYGGGVGSHGAARNNIWAQSAAEKGFVNTTEGIKFIGNNEKKELSQINKNATCGNATHSGTALVTAKPIRPWVVTPDNFLQISDEIIDYEQLIRDSELVSLQDSAPAYLAITFAQYNRCYLTEEGQVGPWKNRDIGSVGIRCKWCQDIGPLGNFFPHRRGSLSQTSTLKSIVRHVCSCPKCPEYIAHAISTLSDANTSERTYIIGGHLLPNDGKYSRAQFIDNVWNRLNSAGIPKGEEINLFRPIQDSDNIDPIMEYECLEPSSSPLVDNKGRRVSVCVEGLNCDAFALPASKKSKI
jgi:hypothetical protein